MNGYSGEPEILPKNNQLLGNRRVFEEHNSEHVTFEMLRLLASSYK